VAPYAWDGLHGLNLPGYFVAHKIMIALVFACSSTRSLGGQPAPNFGLVLNDRTYCRQFTALGRVLGGLKGIQAGSGWLSSCPAPRGKSIKGWVRIKGIDYPSTISFPKSEFLGQGLPRVFVQEKTQ